MFKEQWNMSDIIDEEDKDNERDAEVTGDVTIGAREQGRTIEEIGTVVEIPPQKQKGIRKALKDRVIGNLERTAKLVEKGKTSS